MTQRINMEKNTELPALSIRISISEFILLDLNI